MGTYAQTACLNSGGWLSTWTTEQKRALRFPDGNDARVWIRRFYDMYPTSEPGLAVVRVRK